jgi:diguanylate cyclase (GGDEF)-like protein
VFSPPPVPPRSAVPATLLFDAREAERQAALDRYAILDTAPEPAFDDIVRLAAMVCDVPAAAISFIDRGRLWFKARIGIDQPQLDRAHSLCGHAIAAPRDTLVVEDLAGQAGYARRRRLAGKRARFYAGVPLLSPEGLALGVLNIGDSVPRTLTEQQLEGLQLLARQTQHLLELRRYMREQGRLLSEREASARRAEHARDDLQRRHDDLEYAATHDALTGLYNRAGLARRRAQPEMKRLAEDPYVLAVLDIDHFKQINDRYGHLLGDRALCAVADAISRSVRANDVAVRYGGEEFLVVLPRTRLDGGAELAERIRMQVQQLSLPFAVTVSIGLADGDPMRDIPEAVFERADQALYRAKKSGRNRVAADDTPR